MSRPLSIRGRQSRNEHRDTGVRRRLRDRRILRGDSLEAARRGESRRAAPVQPPTEDAAVAAVPRPEAFGPLGGEPRHGTPRATPIAIHSRARFMASKARAEPDPEGSASAARSVPMRSGPRLLRSAALYIRSRRRYSRARSTREGWQHENVAPGSFGNATSGSSSVV